MGQRLNLRFSNIKEKAKDNNVLILRMIITLIYNQLQVRFLSILSGYCMKILQIDIVNSLMQQLYLDDTMSNLDGILFYKSCDRQQEQYKLTMLLRYIMESIQYDSFHSRHWLKRNLMRLTLTQHHPFQISSQPYIVPLP